MAQPIPPYVPAHGLLKGKTVLITAAAGGGIGFAAAKRCLEEGARALMLSDIPLPAGVIIPELTHRNPPVVSIHSPRVAEPEPEAAAAPAEGTAAAPAAAGAAPAGAEAAKKGEEPKKDEGKKEAAPKKEAAKKEKK